MVNLHQASNIINDHDLHISSPASVLMGAPCPGHATRGCPPHGEEIDEQEEDVQDRGDARHQDLEIPESVVTTGFDHHGTHKSRGAVVKTWSW